MKTKLWFITVFFSGLALSPLVRGEGNESDQLRAKVRLYCDSVQVDIPNEVKPVAVTTKTPSLTTREESKQVRVNIVATPFWAAKEEEVKNLSIPVYDIRADCLQTVTSFKGRLLDSTTQKGLTKVRVKLSSEAGDFLAETDTDNEGFFTLLGWLDKTAKKVKLDFHLEKYQDQSLSIDLTPNSLIMVGPVVLTPSQPVSASTALTKPTEKCNLITVRLEDGLGMSVSGLQSTLELTSKEGITTRWRMRTGNDMYSFLVEESEATQCTIQLDDPQSQWDSINKIVDCSQPQVVILHLTLKGETFAKGTVENCHGCRVWLVQAADQVYEPIEIVSPDESGKFLFRFRPGMDKFKYRMAVSWEPLSGITPVWVSPKEYTPRSLGGSEQYSLGTDLKLEVPTTYLTVFPTLVRIHYGNELRATTLVPNYGEADKIIASLNDRLQQVGKPAAIAVNLAKSFQVSLPSDSTVQITTNDNRFEEGYELALSQGHTPAPILFSVVPVGRPATVKSMKKAMTDTVNKLLTEAVIQTVKLLIIYGDGIISAQEWQAKQTNLDTVKIVEAPPSASFSNSLQSFVFDPLQTQNLLEANAKPNMVLLIDGSLLDAFQEDSFNLTNLKGGNFGSVTIVVFSEAYMGDQTKYAGKIGLLKKAFEKADFFEGKVVNPIDTPDLETVLNGIILNSVPKDYSWLPIQQSSPQPEKVETGIGETLPVPAQPNQPSKQAIPAK